MLGRFEHDKNHPMICNHLAKHVFWQWYSLPGTASVVKGSPVVTTSTDLSTSLAAKHPVRLGKQLCYVQAVKGTRVTLSLPYPGLTNEAVPVARRKFELAMNLATGALKQTNNPQIQAESNYIIGRCYHAQGVYPQAHMRYTKALGGYMDGCSRGLG